MRHIAVIPARSGSKSIINKNLIRIGHKRLFDYTIEKVLEADFFSEVIISSDIQVLYEYAMDNKGITYHRRDKKLCKDDTLMRDVVLDVIEKSKLNSLDYLWLLQPTTPFRSMDNFQEVRGILEVEQPKSLISVCDVGAFHPCRMLKLRFNGALERVKNSSFSNKQDLPQTYIRNGAFYCVRIRDFLKEKEFFLKPCQGYIMKRLHSVNIDDPLDAVLADALAKKRLV